MFLVSSVALIHANIGHRLGTLCRSSFAKALNHHPESIIIIPYMRNCTDSRVCTLCTAHAYEDRQPDNMLLLRRKSFDVMLRAVRPIQSYNGPAPWICFRVSFLLRVTLRVGASQSDTGSKL